MRVVDAVARILRDEGVQYVFCYPVNNLIEACAAAGIRPIVCRQERVGMGMADGFSRTSNGKPLGVFTCQQGPGAENAFSGIATAFGDSTPVLVFPHSAPTDRFGVPRVFSPMRAFDPITKSIQVLNRPDRTGEIMRRALSAVRTGRPGPVAVEIPDDVGDAEVGEASLTYGPVPPVRSAGDPGDVDRAAGVLLEAKNPVIFAGHGVLQAEASDRLVQLAELIQAPVMTTLLGKGGFPEDHPLSAGTAAGVAPGTVPHFLGKADVIFAIGTSLTKHAISSAALPPGKVIVHAVSDPGDVNRDYLAQHAIVGDSRLVLEQMIEAVRDRLGGKGRDANAALVGEIRTVHRQWLEQWLPKLTSDEVPVNPYRVVWELMQAVDPAQTIITHDSGSPRSQLAPFYRATTPRGYIGFGKAHALGSSLGLIMGAKLARPDKLCINWLGDGAFGMVGTDFETAARNQIPILSVLSNNFEMATETARMTVSHGRYQTRATLGNYADMAKAMGGYAERVEQPAEVRPAIGRARRATEEGRPALVEVITSAETAISGARPT
ncbi:MAG TPA: thiamine pyrophosphate-requiring protein [Chloroflexota bacterium]|nr:thiamine pyrophosphate-requiring protein [Chloroflexota bacterium]